MTNLELVDPKHPALHTKAVLDPFEDNTIDWEDTEQSMFYLMDRFMGVGLASSQVGLSYKIDSNNNGFLTEALCSIYFSNTVSA